MANEHQQTRMFRLKDVERISGLKKSQIYELARNGSFPRPIKLSVRASGWTSTSIQSWLDSRIEASRKQA
jgi:prophage regulatory protein